MKILTVMLLIVTAMVLSGCNTMNGLGQDLENLGVMVQGETDKDEAAEVDEPATKVKAIPQSQDEIIYTEEPSFTEQ